MTWELDYRGTIEQLQKSKVRWSRCFLALEIVNVPLFVLNLLAAVRTPWFNGPVALLCLVNIWYWHRRRTRHLREYDAMIDEVEVWRFDQFYHKLGG